MALNNAAHEKTPVLEQLGRQDHLFPWKRPLGKYEQFEPQKRNRL
jgi:hypothetical protein